MENTEQEEINVKGESEASTEAEAEVKATEQEEAVTEKKEEDFKEKYFYLAAQMQNMEKRFEREKDNLYKFGNEKVMKDLIDVLDNFERTLGFIEKDEDEKVKNIVVGIEMITKMFLDSLSKHGLKKIEALDQEFDPNFHEALSQRAEEGKENNTIVEVFQNGYTLNDRVLRAAKVIIVKND